MFGIQWEEEMTYLKTSSKLNRAQAQPAPDFNCGWSVLNLLSSLTLQAQPLPARKVAQVFVRADIGSVREAGEQSISNQAHHHRFS